MYRFDLRDLGVPPLGSQGEPFSSFCLADPREPSIHCEALPASAKSIAALARVPTARLLVPVSAPV